MDDCKENRIIYFDLLRIFATFAVIMLHVAASNWNTSNINSFDWNIFNFYDSIVRWGVPIFVMISGALFLNSSKHLREIYKKNIFRIITAFIFWQIIYSIYRVLNGLDIKEVIKFFFHGEYHLWFLYMIVGLYIITPFIKKIVENEFLTKYFIILALIFTILVPQLISILSIISSDFSKIMQMIINKIQLNFILGFTLYYILGYYIDKININDKLLKNMYMGGILGFLSTIILTVILSQYTGRPNGLFYSEFSLNVLLESLFVFVIFKNKFSNIKLKDKVKNIIYILSKYSFGAYLVHVLVINLLQKLLNLNTLSFNPVISVPFITLIVFILSFCISAVINHIPKLNKYIV